VGGNSEVFLMCMPYCLTSDPHYDPEKFPALLSYYEGLETAPWTGGGELIIPEARLSVVPQPRTQVIIVCLQTHVLKANIFSN